MEVLTMRAVVETVLPAAAAGAAMAEVACAVRILFFGLLFTASVNAAAPLGTANTAAVTVKDSNKAQFSKAAADMKAGMAFEKAGQYKKAYYEYSKIVDNKINYPQVYKRIANCYYAFRNYEFAIKFYKRYLQFFPKDNATAAYVKKLEDGYKTKEKTRVSENIAGAEFKSPYSAMMFSQIGMIPPACLFQGYGSYYARNRTQSWFPVSSSMAILGEFLLVGDWGIRVNEVTTLDPLLAFMENFSAYLLSSALIFDFISSPFIATESSLDFLYFAKNNEMKLEDKKVDYRDPAFTALVSLTAGIIPGAGHYYAGDTDTAIKLLIFTPLVAGGTMITGGILWGSSDQKTRNAGMYTFYSGLGLYMICRMIDLYGSLAHTDKVSEEYYKQLLCPNSPFVLTKKLPEKEPWLAFAISLIPIPGTGNFYAENYWTSGTLLAGGIAGAAIYFGVSGTDTVSKYIKYGGLALLALSKIYDIASAPGYTAIYNAVYTDRQEREKNAAKVTVFPSLMPGGAGVNMAYSF
jgi:tetratricopeptide (TPR) repeat protein